MKKILLLNFVLGALIFSNCGNDDDLKTSCNIDVSEFQTLFDSIVSIDHQNRITFDTEIHEYTFVLTEEKELCGIGYQSDSDIESTPYLIEIIDSSQNIVVYSDSHVFSSTETSYEAPSTNISLQAGISYTIRRIQTDWGTNISNTIGRLATKPNMDFPYSNSFLEITSSNFYQRGGPLVNLGIPYIDILLN